MLKKLIPALLALALWTTMPTARAETDYSGYYAYIETAWEEGGFLHALLPFGVTKGEDGFPIYEDRPLHGLHYPQREEERLTANPANPPRPSPDAAYGEIILAGDGSVDSFTSITYREYLDRSYQGRRWEAGGPYAKYIPFGLERDESNNAIFHGKPVQAIIDTATGSRLYESHWNADKGEPEPMDEDGVFLRAVYQLVGLEEISFDEFSTGQSTPSNLAGDGAESPYAAFDYHEALNLYQGNLYVLGFYDEGHHFTVALSGDGALQESLPGATFDGYVYLVAERDEEGTLTGIRSVSLDEFAAIPSVAASLGNAETE